MFAIMPFPVLRSMMSKVVSKSEQGELLSENHCSKAKLLIQLDVSHKSSSLLKRPWLCGIKAFIQSGVKLSSYVKRKLKVVLFALLPCIHSYFEKRQSYQTFPCLPSMFSQERSLPVWLLWKTWAVTCPLQFLAESMQTLWHGVLALYSYWVLDSVSFP